MADNTTNRQTGNTMGESKPICCGNFEKILDSFGWFSYEDDNGDTIMLMPYLVDSGSTLRRVTHCPICGAYVRDVKIPAITLIQQGIGHL